MFLITSGQEDATSVSLELLALTEPLAEQAKRLGGSVLITGEAIMSAELSRTISRDSVLVVAVMTIMTAMVFIVTRAFSTTLVSIALNLYIVLLQE